MEFQNENEEWLAKAQRREEYTYAKATVYEGEGR